MVVCAVRYEPVSGWQFPGIREFYREFRDSGAQRHDLVPRNRCGAATSRAIPYADYQRKYSEEQRIFKRYQGFTGQEWRAWEVAKQRQDLP
jgi:hypothetical protein